MNWGRAAHAGRAIDTHSARRIWRKGFTLLEVMIAVAFIGIAMLALLSLHQSNLDAVIRSQDLTKASMLAQQLMSTAEASRFPPPGWTRGDFSRDYPGEYPNFRWEREVEVIPQFPDMCQVSVIIRYGHNFGRTFKVVEFMHNPTPPPMPGQDINTPSAGADDAQPDAAQ